MSSAVPLSLFGRMMPSFMRRNVGSSSHGRPMRPRNTADGNGTASSSVKWQLPRSANVSRNRLNRAAMSPSIASIRLGANSGSNTLRYLA